ncbi:hypothetical protein MKEN_01229800 [Mycena kentingensis (nom. inval.)]|nr:hypothetical protein MKEN_01229800 [Mycena kentingensis (nom. inval.)]
MATNQTFDDRDVGHLHYSTGWSTDGTFNASNTGQTGTLASTKLQGANVTFVFPTPATDFYYFGIRRCCGGSYLICIDCDPDNRQFDTIDAVNTTDDGKNPAGAHTRVSQAHSLGIHEVILVNAADTRFTGGNSQITLDQFVLTVPDPNAGNGGGASSITSTGRTNTGAATAASSSTSSSTASAKFSTSFLAPLLGGLLGGLVLLALIGLCLFLRRRKRQRLLEREDRSFQPQFVGQMGTGRHNPRPQQPPQMYDRNGADWAPAQSQSTASYPVSSYTTTSHTRRETDAGRIATASETASLSSPGILPPDYGDVFATASDSGTSTPALAFYYYGIKRCCGGMYRISVDGTPFIQIDAVGSAHGESGDNSPEVLFSQQFDTPGIHSVVLENIADVRYPNGNSQITLDRFVLAVQDDSTQLPVTDTPLPPSSPSTTEISTSGGSEPTKTTSIQLTDGPTPSFTSSAMQSLESRPSESRASSATQSTMTHNNPPGSSPLSKPSIMSSPTKNLPVGLSVGLGLLVATIAASIVWLLRRRCKRRQKLQTRQPDAFMLKYDSGSYTDLNGKANTLASASPLSAVVSFVFPVQATAVFYYGIKRCCGGRYLICVDCDPTKIEQFEEIDAVDPRSTNKTQPTVLFSRRFDKPGVHTHLPLTFNHLLPTMSKELSFDNVDPAFQYAAGQWFQGTFKNSTGQEDTLASSNSDSASVSFVFPVPATEFFYYGIKRCCGGRYLICVDCDPSKPNAFQVIDGVELGIDGSAPPVILFSRKFDTPGIHTVHLRNAADPRFGGRSQITIDRFVLSVPDTDQAPAGGGAIKGDTAETDTSTGTPTKQPTVSLASSSQTPAADSAASAAHTGTADSQTTSMKSNPSSQSGAGSGLVAESSSLPESTDTPDAQQATAATSSSSRTPIIVGVVLGLFALGLLILGLWLVRRHRRRRLDRVWTPKPYEFQQSRFRNPFASQAAEAGVAPTVAEMRPNPHPQPPPSPAYDAGWNSMGVYEAEKAPRYLENDGTRRASMAKN